MSKLSVMVDFPIHGLDLTNHLASRSQSSSHASQEIQGNYRRNGCINNIEMDFARCWQNFNGFELFSGNGYHPGIGTGWKSMWSPLRMRQSFRSSANSQNICLQNSPPRMDEHVYDLYAVCNHHGTGLIGGHYTGMRFSKK